MHNEGSRSEELVEELKTGGRIGVVSDAGTPGIADPGGQIAAAAIAAGIAVYPVPGANAAISGLIASQMGTETFTFHDFYWLGGEGSGRDHSEELERGGERPCFL